MPGERILIRSRDGSFQREVEDSSIEEVKAYLDQNSANFPSDVEIMPSAQAVDSSRYRPFIEQKSPTSVLLDKEQQGILDILPGTERSLQESGFLQPGQQIDLGQELGNLGTRWNLQRDSGMFGVRIGNQLRKLKDAGFETAIVPDGRNGYHVVVKDPTGHAYLVNSPFRTSWGDVGDKLPNPEEAIAGLAISAAQPELLPVTQTGPSRILQTMLRSIIRGSQVAGAEAAGTLIREQLTNPLFTSAERPGLIFGDEGQASSVQEALGTFASTFAGEQVGNALSIFHHPFVKYREFANRGFTAMGEVEKRALRAQQPFDLFRTGDPVRLPELSAAFASPLQRRQLTQSAITKSAEQRLRGYGEDAFRELYEATKNVDPLDLPLETVDEIRRRYQKRIDQAFVDKNIPVGNEDALFSIQQGVKHYNELQTIKIANLYRDAKDAARGSGAVFDLTSAANEADASLLGRAFPALDTGALVEGAPLPLTSRYQIGRSYGGTVSVYDTTSKKRYLLKADGTDYADTPSDLPYDIRRMALEGTADRNGYVTKFPVKTGIHDTVHDPELINLLGEIASHVRDNKGRLRTEDLELLRSWRTDLFYMGQRLESEDARVAARVHWQLSNAMGNPIGGNPEQTRLLKLANNENLTLENVQSNALIRAYLIDGADPYKLGKEYIKPDNLVALRNLRTVLGDDGFENVRAGFLNNLMEDPLTIDRKLTQYRNMPGYKMLVKPDVEANLYAYSRAWNQFNQGGIVELSRNGFKNLGDLMLKLEKGQTGDIDEFIKGIGGLDSPQGRSLQAAIVAEALDSSRIVKGERAGGVDPAKMVEYINGLEANGMLEKFFHADQIQMLKDVQAYMSLLPSEKTDVGSALILGRLASALKPAPLDILIHPMEKVKAGVDLYSNYITARILLSTEMRRIWQAGNRVDRTDWIRNERHFANFVATLGPVYARAKADAEDLQGVKDTTIVHPQDIQLKDGRWEPPNMNVEELLRSRGVQELFTPSLGEDLAPYTPKGY